MISSILERPAAAGSAGSRPHRFARPGAERFGGDATAVAELLAALPERAFGGAAAAGPDKARLLESFGRVAPHRFGRALAPEAPSSYFEFDAFRSFAEEYGLAHYDNGALLARNLRQAAARVTGGADPVVAVIAGEGGRSARGRAWRPLRRMLLAEGLDCYCGEFADLSLRDGRVCLRGAPVDVVYRTFEPALELGHPEGSAMAEVLRRAHEAGTVLLWTPLESEGGRRLE